MVLVIILVRILFYCTSQIMCKIIFKIDFENKLKILTNTIFFLKNVKNLKRETNITWTKARTSRIESS